MGIWKSLEGTYTVSITSASPVDTLTAMSKRGVELFNVLYINPLCIQGCVRRSDYIRFAECITGRGEEWKIIKKCGLYWAVTGLRQRPILVLACLLFALMVLYLPTRVLFVQVEGNNKISEKQIIEQAESCGIRFGASRRAVRSEKMKNALLSAVPQLQWAGVNTVGCVAVISVQERSDNAESPVRRNVNSIIAAQDAVIQEITVLQGNALCKVGQAVKKGQVLVSGYTDCGIYVKAEAAEAEIQGSTLRFVNAVSPANHMYRERSGAETTQYSVRIGKNIINFCKDSGISGMECAKMYKEKVLTLPGGFQLPIALVTETLYWYTDDVQSEAREDEPVWLLQAAETYIRDHMVAGKVLGSDADVQLQNDVYQLYGQYFCQEDIGQIRCEMRFISDGEDDRENH